MPRTKRLVCLANSRKLTGRCVAGREWDEKNGAGDWVRPVSGREHEEVSAYERRYIDGSDPRVLDVVDVPVLKPQPKTYQAENWLLDPQRRWEKAGTYSPRHIDALVDPAERLWIDGHSTWHGKNDRIPAHSANSVASSLRLVRVDELRVRILTPGAEFGNSKRRVQGRFLLSGKKYALWITDLEFEGTYLAKPDGRSYRLEGCYLTISLGEPYDGYVYKLIAAVIEPGPVLPP